MEPFLHNRSPYWRKLSANETATQSEMLVEILGSVSAQRPGGCGFDPRPSHTKDYKKELLGTQYLGLVLEAFRSCNDS